MGIENQITRKHLESARNEQRLVDVSDEARQVGFSCSCEVDVHLWNCLFWKYPSAETKDVLDVGQLLRVLRDRLASGMMPGLPSYYICPPQPTWWMKTRYFLHLKVIYRDDVVESVVILRQCRTVESLFLFEHPPLPASLLVRLYQSVRRFWPLCFRSERPLVRSLDETVRLLLRRSPLYSVIYKYLDLPESFATPTGFSLEEYRQMMLRSLLTQLELTAALAEKMGTDINLPVSGLLQLMANYVGVVPASEDGALLGEKRQFH